eukprot:4649945-Pyramimonas_sp.AAC.1
MPGHSHGTFDTCGSLLHLLSGQKAARALSSSSDRPASPRRCARGSGRRKACAQNSVRAHVCVCACARACACACVRACVRVRVRGRVCMRLRPPGSLSAALPRSR